MGFACTSRVLPAPSVTKRPRAEAATVGVSDEASNKLSTTTPSLLRMSTAKLTVAPIVAIERSTRMRQEKSAP